MNASNRISILFCLTAGLLLNTAWAFDANAHPLNSNPLNERQLCKTQLHGEIFSRTELFFGLSRADGPDVTEAEFQGFIDTEDVYKRQLLDCLPGNNEPITSVTQAVNSVTVKFAWC